ncbi:SDR family oxidoreductase [Microlunatus ginsengisoli]|uniref:SDR family oxidoreductase n=1 Tax=Microlunatus ginsengisoli TaxID=363863 RepID=A0ABP7A865_9ACTN
MKVFVTGASGWIGSATVAELLADGHEVTGLVRSEASADRLRSAGATPLAGDLDDLDSIRRGAAGADAVIHLANKHDWSDPANSNRAERASVETIAETLLGSDRPFLFASGVAFAPGRVVTEDDRDTPSGPDAPRGGSEALAMDYAERGVHSVSLRFAPTVHGAGDHGFIAQIVRAARERGVSGYIGDGTNRWPAVHVVDAARLVARALGSAPAGSVVHAVAEEGVPARDIAEAIGSGLGLRVESIEPDRAVEHFGWIGRFFALDLPASSAATRARFGWAPTAPTLLEDLAGGSYFAA